MKLSICGIGIAIMLVGFSVAEEPIPRESTKRTLVKPVSNSRSKEIRQREGTKLVEIAGRFMIAGERVTFVPQEAAEGVAYRVLENLALERVLDNLNESRSDRLWIVSGTLSEYRGANYLLISKAVLQSPTADPAP